jgi:hypothetical protein
LSHIHWFYDLGIGQYLYSGLFIIYDQLPGECMKKSNFKYRSNLFILLCFFVLVGIGSNATADTISSPDGKGYRFEKDGWTYLHIEGAPYERGFQHGYLMAPEIAEVQDTIRYLTYHDTGMEWDYFLHAANEMFPAHIDEEFLTEMKGIAEGAQEAGTNVSFEEILGWNAYKELTGYWWPTVKSEAYKKMEIETDSCSAFIATGDFTEHGDIVLGHNTWTAFERAHFFDLLADVQPEDGNRIFMQTAPGLLDSSTDYLVTSAGLMIAETTINSFNQYKANMSPAFYRLRNAAQYADNLDEFVSIMNTNRSGGFANSWLVGDAKTGEIMRFEQGLKFFNVTKTDNGYFAGANSAEDPRIRNLECSSLDPTDIRTGVSARMVRIPQLIEQFKGKISTETGKKILSDEYDVWLQKENPSTRTVNGVYWLDSNPYPNRPPFKPMGAYDGKVMDSEMAKNMSIEARWGSPSGRVFDADTFLSEHPQYGYLKGYLKSFPTHSWNVFHAGEKE